MTGSRCWAAIGLTLVASVVVLGNDGEGVDVMAVGKLLPEIQHAASHIWRPLQPEYVSPELEIEELSHYLGDRPNFGIALAGGGGRGASLAHGAFRALRNAGIMDQARYLSVTSGSVWFGVPLYHQINDSLDVFLGASLAPEQLTPENLTSPAIAGSYISRLTWPITRYPNGMNMTRMKHTAALGMPSELSQREERRMAAEEENSTTWGTPGWTTAIEKMVQQAHACFTDVPACLRRRGVLKDANFHELWNLLVGWTYLRPFGLTERGAQFAHETQVDRVRKLLGANTTIFPTRDRSQGLPFLLSQAAVLVPGTGTDQHNNPLKFFSMETSALATGLPVAVPEPFSPGGNVMVEPFAMSSVANSAVMNVSAIAGSREEVWISPQLNSAFNLGALSQWAGVATCYPADFQAAEWAARISKSVITAFEKILPHFWMWSPERTGTSDVPQTVSVPVGDAGIYDDLGHLPLLRRRVSKMLIVDSSAVHDNSTGVEKENLFQMCYFFPAFGQSNTGLGYPPGSPNPWMANGTMTVFEPSEFAPLWTKIQKLYNAGKPVVVRGNYTVVDNARLGIKGGWKVDIVWVIALPVPSWRQALPESTNTNLPSYFPNYNAKQVFSQFQMSAISQFGSWLIERSALNDIHQMLQN